MKIVRIGRMLIGVCMFLVAACAIAPRTINPYFEMPPDYLLQYERKLFALALQKQTAAMI